MSKGTENQAERHTDTERTNRLAPTDRVRSEVRPDPGRSQHARATANLEQWNRAGHRYPEIEAARAKLRADLDAHLGPGAPPANTALAPAAVMLFTAVLLADRRLLTGGGRGGKLNDLLQLLPALVGALQRCLRLLGAQDGQSDQDAPPENATPEARREWARNYVASVLADDRSPTP